jgi:subtilisin family serine protease
LCRWEAGLARARDNAHPLPDTLLVKSAGNESSTINGPEDAILCGGSATPRLAVGAYDLTGAPAKFTNTGACVDVLAPGTSVITPLPHGWIFPLDGTSFSAPLVARMVSLDNAAFTTQGAHDKVVAGGGASHNLPQAQFPRALFYDPRGMLGTQSLSHESPLAAMTGGLPQQRFSMRALDKLLAGLHRGGR